jgi:crotonobetainyl-CoA:carnitine CoA-transferase CaiB-like acyl-CoA transferase
LDCETGDKLKTLIEDKLAHRTTAEWEAFLIPAGVPCSAINNVAELKARHPEVFVTVRLNHFFIEYQKSRLKLVGFNGSTSDRL